MPWTVLRIQEADFGCEEREPGEKTKVLVTLQSASGEEKQLLVEDDWLHANQINEGSDWQKMPQ